MDSTSIDLELRNFILLGINQAICSLFPGDGPFVPFAMIVSGDDKRQITFATEDVDDGIREAELYIKTLSPEPDLSLIAFDGFITLDGEKYDAVFVRANGKNYTETMAYQRYVFTPDGLETIGSMKFLK